MPKRERSTPAGRTPRWLWLLELLALYAVIAALFATERVMVYYGSPQAPTWAESFRLSAAPWSAWFLLTPLIVYLTRLYPFESPIRQRSLVVHAGALVAITFLQAFLNIYIGVVISVLWDNYHTTWEDMLWIPPSVILRYSLRNPLIYAIVAGITSTVDYYRKFKDREIRAAQLESQLSRARLQALQSQIHPHFLFNTLNAVTALMRRDVEGAERMLVRLADLLRRTLEGGESQEIPLRQELDLLEAYLGIEQVRFSDRLTVVQEIDPGALEEPVPRLILQPLAENAVRHGLAPSRGPCTIWILARRTSEALELEVSDDGVGLGEESAVEGLGLMNTRARLKALYGEGARFELGARSGGGATAAMRIPRRTLPAQGRAPEADSQNGEEAS